MNSNPINQQQQQHLHDFSIENATIDPFSTVSVLNDENNVIKELGKFVDANNTSAAHQLSMACASAASSSIGACPMWR